MTHKHAQYPNEFFDQVKERLGVVTDHQLAKWVGIDLSVIRRTRLGERPISASNLISIYDATGWSIEELRSLLYQKPLFDRANWTQTQDSRPTLKIKIKPPGETSDVQRAHEELQRLKSGAKKPYERATI